MFSHVHIRAQMAYQKNYCRMNEAQAFEMYRLLGTAMDFGALFEQDKKYQLKVWAIMHLGSFYGL